MMGTIIRYYPFILQLWGPCFSSPIIDWMVWMFAFSFLSSLCILVINPLPEIVLFCRPVFTHVVACFGKAFQFHPISLTNSWLCFLSNCTHMQASTLCPSLEVSVLHFVSFIVSGPTLDLWLLLHGFLAGWDKDPAPFLGLTFRPPSAPVEETFFHLVYVFGMIIKNWVFTGCNSIPKSSILSLWSMFPFSVNHTMLWEVFLSSSVFFNLPFSI